MRVHDETLVGKVAFHEYVTAIVKTKNWALCRNTKGNRMRYEVCLSQSKFFKLEGEYLEDGGNPDEVTCSIAKEHGWELRWIRV